MIYNFPDIVDKMIEEYHDFISEKARNKMKIMNNYFDYYKSGTRIKESEIIKTKSLLKRKTRRNLYLLFTVGKDEFNLKGKVLIFPYK